MSLNIVEQRKFKRFFFPKQEVIRAVFSFSDAKELIFDARVLNLSELGLGLVVHRSAANTTSAADDLKAGDILHLKEVAGNPDLEFMREIQSEIRWVVNAQWMDNIGFGCEFIDISAELREKIRFFIDFAEKDEVSSA